MMIGFGESFLSSFAVALGGNSLQIGMLTSLPPVIAALAQLGGLQLFRRHVARKTIITRGVFFQGLSWFLIATFAGYSYFLKQPASMWLLLFLWAFYSASGNMTGPAWNSLIGDLVPEKVRGSYFGFRNQRSGWITVISMLIGGCILYLARMCQIELLGFALLFIFAGFARLESGFWLSRYDEPGYVISAADQFTLWNFIRRIRHSNFAKFVLFFALMNGAAAISGSYFTLYLLRDLKCTYLTFSTLITLQLLSQYFFMNHWGQLCDEFGNKRILTFCTSGVCFSGVVWILSDNFWYMVAAQLYAGLFWAGFNLAGANFLFDAVKPTKRAQCATYLSLINSAAVCIGTYIGGIAVTHLPDQFLVYNSILGSGHSIYFKIFALSMILRITIGLCMIRTFSEVRDVTPIRNRDILLRISRLHHFIRPTQ